MEDARTNILNQHLKAYDRKLYAVREDRTGMIQVFRENSRPYSFEYKDVKYTALLPNPFFILALTDNWTLTGKPVEWGIDPLIQRLRSIDGHMNGVTVEDLINDYEKGQASKDKKRKDDSESWLRDNRNVFKRAFEGINTSNMNVKQKGI